jgi:hypothetical protein
MALTYKEFFHVLNNIREKGEVVDVNLLVEITKLVPGVVLPAKMCNLVRKAQRFLEKGGDENTLFWHRKHFALKKKTTSLLMC